MKRLFLPAAAASAALSACAAIAADFPLAKDAPAAPPAWTGHYGDAKPSGAWATTPGLSLASFSASSDIARNGSSAAQERASLPRARDEVRSLSGGTGRERRFAHAFFGASIGEAFGPRSAATYVRAFPLSQTPFENSVPHPRDGANDLFDSMLRPFGTRF